MYKIMQIIQNDFHVENKSVCLLLSKGGGALVLGYILKSYRGVFPPSQKLKDIPTKCTFWVNFVGKTLRSDKKAI
jgi:hypothetical protein